MEKKNKKKTQALKIRTTLWWHEHRCFGRVLPLSGDFNLTQAWIDLLAQLLQALAMLNLQRSVTVIHTSSSCAHCVPAVWFMSTRLVFHCPETELFLRFQQSHHEIRRKIGINEATGGAKTFNGFLKRAWTQKLTRRWQQCGLCKRQRAVGRGPESTTALPRCSLSSIVI